MKPMLYAGAALMIGASIYGFVDYKQTHNKKGFKDMYTAQKPVSPVIVTQVKENTAIEKTNAVEVKKAGNKKKTVIKKEEVKAIKPIASEEKMTTSVKKLTEEIVEKPEPSKVPAVIKKKKIRKEFFSRGKIIDDEELANPVNKENNKPDKTAQKEL